MSKSSSQKVERAINMQVVDEIRLFPTPAPFRYFMVDEDGYLVGLTDNDILDLAFEIERKRDATEKG